MKKTITLSLLSFLFVFTVFAQQQRECAVLENLEYRKQQDPQLEARMAKIEAFTQQKVKELEAQQGAQNKIVGSIITIPVVVHVLYRNATENISVAQIQSQLDVLNEDFRRTNADANNVWSQAADTQIEFCLSTVDPNGNTTTGITRKSTTRRNWGLNDEMKSASTGGIDPWNTSEYLNMWIVPQMLRPTGETILGYAQFPGGSAATDGCVMSYNYFGRTGAVTAPFDGGRTTTHEIGHYFNLRHIWGDSNCGNDQVSDTPTAQTANYGCATGRVSCGSTDMVQNYMDYSDDSCMNLFTTGQKNRMRAVLAAGGARRTLALSDKCGGTTTTPTCTDGIQNGTETGVDCGGSCTPCQTGPQYCASQGNSVNDEYISRVQLGSINNSSGAQLYSDFTSTTSDLDKGSAYTITVTPTWTGTKYNEGYAAWIDYNNDGDFTDAGEQIFSKTASQTAPVSGNFTVPAGTADGNKRLRVSMKYNGVPTACETFSYGEVEDYTVNIKTGATPQDKCDGVSEYVSGQSYAVGDRVTYFGTLYERTSTGWINLGACGTARSSDEGFVQYLGVDISVYPNPVKGNTLFVKSNVENLHFIVVNMLGQQVAKGTSSNGVDVSNLEVGMYMIQFSVNEKLETRKFIKQ